MNSMADSMARDRAVRLDITVPSSKRAREEENGDAGGDVGPPEAQRARAGERAPGTVAQPAPPVTPPAAITSQAAAPGGGSNGGGGEPETAKTKSDQPAEKVSPAAATTTPNPPAGAATFESETYQLEVSRGGKGRGD